MKKIISLLVISLILCGCASEASIKKDLTKLFDEASNMAISAEANMRRSYFDYYLPRHIGKQSQDNENALFISNGVPFYMNLNVPSVIIESYYSKNMNVRSSGSRYSELKEVGEVYYYTYGELLNNQNEMHKYAAYINKLGKGQYFVFLEYGYVDFAAVCYLADLENLLYDMLSIGRSVVVDKDLVIASFSNKVEYVINKQYNLFEQAFPESGVIFDVLNPSTGGSNADEGEVKEELDIENEEKEEEQAIDEEEN